MKTLRFFPLLFASLTAGLVPTPMSCAAASPTTPMPTQHALSERARTTLLDVLQRDETFIKVHAAEILNARGETARVREVFLRELERSSEVSGYRVGIWRVLAQSAASPNERSQWIAKIAAAFMDAAAADRLGAIESLAKL